MLVALQAQMQPHGRLHLAKAIAGELAPCFAAYALFGDGSDLLSLSFGRFRQIAIARFQRYFERINARDVRGNREHGDGAGSPVVGVVLTIRTGRRLLVSEPIVGARLA